jgi:ketosteroid isomerase-like protein
MSEENIALARRGYDAFSRGDINGVLAFLDPDVEVLDSPELPDHRVWRGHEGVLGNFRNIQSVVEGYEVAPEEFIDAGDKLVVTVRVSGRGAGSGIRIEDRLLHVWTIRNGKAVRLENYRDRTQALTAAGLTPEDSTRASTP